MTKAYIGIHISEDPFWNCVKTKRTVVDYSLGWIFG